MNLNRVCLVGLVAWPPRAGRLLVATRDDGHIERHVVVVRAELAGEPLATGDTVYVEGHLEHHGGAARVAAHRLWRIAEGAREQPAKGVPLGTHASPRPHQRRGHWRRVGLRTAAERLVWVSPTLVGVGVHARSRRADSPGRDGAEVSTPALGAPWASWRPTIVPNPTAGVRDRLGGPGAPWSMGSRTWRARMS